MKKIDEKIMVWGWLIGIPMAVGLILARTHTYLAISPMVFMAVLEGYNIVVKLFFRSRS